MLLRHAPQLALELFIHAGVLPAETATWSVRLRPTEGIVIRPEQKRRELRADLVLMVAAPEVNIDDAYARKRALKTGQAFGVICEIQRVKDASKRETWADFYTAYRLDLGTDIRLVIFTFDAEVKQWALEVSKRIKQLLNISVVTPDDCPMWSSIGGEYKSERAVLDAVLHARDASHLGLVEAALAAIEGWDDSLAVHCEEMLMAQVGATLIQQAIAARDARTPTMSTHTPSNQHAYDYLNSPRPIIQVAVNVGREAGRKTGLQEGRQEGRQAGRQEGRQEGEIEARAKVVVELLDHRRVALDPDSRARILACREPETLARWLIAASQVTDAAQLLEG